MYSTVCLRALTAKTHTVRYVEWSGDKAACAGEAAILLVEHFYTQSFSFFSFFFFFKYAFRYSGFVILFCVTARIGLHALMPKKHISSLLLQHSLHSPLFLKHSVSAPVSLRPAPPEYRVCSEWSAHKSLRKHR